MLVAVISDTHLPKGGRTLPASCVERLRAADLILHAGDLSTLAVLEELRSYGEVRAVAGNVDTAEVRALLPARLEVELQGVRIGMVHDAGRAAGRLERLRAAFPAARAVVFGHSHIPRHERSADGEVQIFNPGSPTERRRAPRHTMGWARVGDGTVEFELIALD
jgi:putative phosphoesterase